MNRRRPNGWLGGLWPLAAGLWLLTPTPLAGEEPILYEVSAIKGKLLRELPAGKEPLAAGARLESGQLLRTGWFSWSDLLAPEFESRFHLGSRTRVRLASDTPGVLLEVEKGRLRALFDELVGEEPVERRIQTPSAVLAVRGTEYGVAVSGSGDTTLVVFSGTVEVVDRQGRVPPITVPSGHALEVRRGRPPGAPYRHAVSARGWDRGGMPATGRVSPGMGSGGGSGAASGRGDGHGGSRRHGG